MDKENEYFSINGEKVNTSIYPDYEGTRYINWEKQINTEISLPKLFERKEDCCGCFACYSVCSQDAIKMNEDLEGFVYPNIDLSKCIKCHMCEKVCPIKCRGKRN